MALDSVGAPCADVMQFLADTGGMIGAPSFIGYASCANLSQDPLMRAGVETLAADTTRQWMDVTHPDMKTRNQGWVSPVRASDAAPEAANGCFANLKRLRKSH